MNKKYRGRLTDEEQRHLEKLVRKGKTHARKLLYARILLKADENGPASRTDERIADAFEVSVATVARERRRYCEEGLVEIALMPKKPGLPRRRLLDGRAEAHLIALACSDPPEGKGALELEAPGRPDGGAGLRKCALLRNRSPDTQKKASSNLTSSASG